MTEGGHVRGPDIPIVGVGQQPHHPHHHHHHLSWTDATTNDDVVEDDEETDLPFAVVENDTVNNNNNHNSTDERLGALVATAGGVPDETDRRPPSVQWSQSLVASGTAADTATDDDTAAAAAANDADAAVLFGRSNTFQSGNWSSRMHDSHSSMPALAAVSSSSSMMSTAESSSALLSEDDPSLHTSHSRVLDAAASLWLGGPLDDSDGGGRSNSSSLPLTVGSSSSSTVVVRQSPRHTHPHTDNTIHNNPAILGPTHPAAAIAVDEDAPAAGGFSWLLEQADNRHSVLLVPHQHPPPPARAIAGNANEAMNTNETQRQRLQQAPAVSPSSPSVPFRSSKTAKQHQTPTRLSPLWEDEASRGVAPTTMPPLEDSYLILPDDTKHDDNTDKRHESTRATLAMHSPSYYMNHNSNQNEDCYSQRCGRQQQQQPHWLFPALPVFSKPSFATSSLSSSSASKERRLATLAGATVVTTGENTFVVSMDLVALASVADDVMHILGNPDMLRLWCDSVSSPLIIVRSSEGARNAANMNHRSSNNNNSEAAASSSLHPQPWWATATPVNVAPAQHRQYEGEWIEAVTTTDLLHPDSNRTTTCCAWTWSALGTMAGFPSRYGKVQMFVERLLGQVSLTLGPFPGNVKVCHTFKVTTTLSSSSMCKTRIVDAVRIVRCNSDEEDSGGSNSLCCGLLDFYSCWESSSNSAGFIDQALSSMARLRFLVEHGESAGEPVMLTTPTSVPLANNPNVHQEESHSPLLV